jgi:glycosyltransferase involved in cell wall biosynthesis
VKIAVTIGTLRIPPTYFAVQHSLALADRHDIRTFALAANIRDPEILRSALTFADFVPFRDGPFRRREVLIPLAIPRMSRSIQAFDPDLIHQHFATWSLPARMAARTIPRPLLVTVHGGDVFAALRSPALLPVRARPMLRWQRRNVLGAFGAADRILAVSGYLASKAVEAGAPARLVEVHYQGIDTDYFTPNAREAEPEPTVLFVGALTNSKGIRDVISASDELQHRHPHELRVVGDGRLRALVEEKASSSARTTYLGSIGRDAVRDEMRRATVLVLPAGENQGAREAAGLVLLEAQASGTPVVAYASGGTPEMMLVGESGLLAAEGDLPALTDAISAILAAGTREWTSMSQRARRFVVEERSLRVSVAQLEQHYRDLTGS